PESDSSRELLSPPAQDDSDEVDTVTGELNRVSQGSSSTSTWSGRVRDLKREVKHRICRLRGAPGVRQLLAGEIRAFSHACCLLCLA
ncbi:hypothetical protein CEXT_150481, partial [Caerostris extrusa]